MMLKIILKVGLKICAKIAIEYMNCTTHIQVLWIRDTVFITYDSSTIAMPWLIDEKNADGSTFTIWFHSIETIAILAIWR